MNSEAADPQKERKVVELNHDELSKKKAHGDSFSPSSPSDSSKNPGEISASTVRADLSDDHLNTDDRGLYEWKSGYGDDAQAEIRFDAWVVAIVMALTLFLLLLTWRGDLFYWLSYGCQNCQRAQFDRYAYFYLGGQLGGILFGIKYLYKVVARGRWSVDRRLWRLFSPFLSGGLALAIAALTESGVLGLTTRSSGGSVFFSIGFIAGYFADNALAKMQEIAETVFGSPEHRKTAAPPKQDTN